jgi:hypothetical protein
MFRLSRLADDDGIIAAASRIYGILVSSYLGEERMTARAIPLALILGFGVAAVAAGAPPERDWAACMSVDPATGESHIDAPCFFDILVDRYRRLSVYEDVAEVSQVTQRTGEKPQRVETRIGCGVEHGRLRVETPASTFRRAVGLDLPFRTSAPLESTALEYNIWLAPHMALKFKEEPKRDFRSGVEDGFTAIEATETIVGDKPMVHLELKSGDGSSEDCEATFDLYVNPDSMLVEHIKGQQRLPDGATYETTLDITPTYIENEAPASVGERPPAHLHRAPGEPGEPGEPGVPGVPGRPSTGLR